MRRWAVVAVVTLAGCAAPGAQPEAGPTGYDDTINIGVPGALVETIEGVEGYPSCRRETVEHEGTTWYPFMPENIDEFPTVVALPTRGGGFGGGMLVAPGPGDDVGTLSVYEGGFAYWASDSGDLETWLTDQALTYPWIC